MDNRVVQHVLAGLSCFVTGEAGTGKTHLLKTLITKLSNKRYVSVTASTGAAASALDGMTLHSYISMRPSSGPLNILDILFYQSIKCVSRIRRTQVLVIDEISMISADMFDCVDKIMRVLRNSNLPFGGVQLILCGDFCQLPPVNGEFCFLSETWMFFKIPTFKLQSVQRAQDERLVNMLREIKCLPKGQALSLRTSETLTSLSREVKDVDGICHTCLCATNRECQTINDAALMKLDGPWFKFSSIDAGQLNLLEGVPAQQMVELCVGAQVLLIVNMNVAEGFTNGSKGVVTKFQLNSNQQLCYPIVEFEIKGETVEKVVRPYPFSVIDGGELLASRSQIPLILAWAITIHKSQGMTIRRLELRLLSVFVSGMAYVALSRGVNLDTMRVVNFDAKNIHADATVINFLHTLSLQ
eukprot:m.240378 g.240378  ORF g.240378 m.240378 type:complete len:413 (-) comp33764_c9_seq1:35-1273(-)